jgi:hypothetical protein
MNTKQAAIDADYYETLSSNPDSLGVTPKPAFGGMGAALGPKGMIAETGMTALSGIFAARAAERARKQQLEQQRDQAQLNVEMNKGQLQQQLLQGLSGSLSNIMMQRAQARAV